MLVSINTLSFTHFFISKSTFIYRSYSTSKKTMATSQTNFRSISLPSRLDHQIKRENFEGELEKLNSCSTSSDSIQSGLLGLAQLYNSVEEFTQKSTDAKSVLEESLSHSVDLLDACSAIKELLQTIRENVHSLQSALRRKGLDSAIQNDVAAYFFFRKKTQKTIAKTLKCLKKSESVIIKNNVDGVESCVIFRQLTTVTISILKSVLVFMTPSSIGGGGSWSLVSKLMAVKSGKESGVVNEIGNMDLGLSSLQGKMRGDGVRVVDLQKQLQTVDDVVEGFEGGLERLFRQLVQTRVSLLNILTNQ